MQANLTYSCFFIENEELNQKKLMANERKTLSLHKQWVSTLITSYEPTPIEQDPFLRLSDANHQ